MNYSSISVGGTMMFGCKWRNRRIKSNNSAFGRLSLNPRSDARNWDWGWEHCFRQNTKHDWDIVWRSETIRNHQKPLTNPLNCFQCLFKWIIACLARKIVTMPNYWLLLALLAGKPFCVFANSGLWWHQNALSESVFVYHVINSFPCLLYPSLCWRLDWTHTFLISELLSVITVETTKEVAKLCTRKMEVWFTPRSSTLQRVSLYNIAISQVLNPEMGVPAKMYPLVI